MIKDQNEMLKNAQRFSIALGVQPARSWAGWIDYVLQQLQSYSELDCTLVEYRQALLQIRADIESRLAELQEGV